MKNFWKRFIASARDMFKRMGRGFAADATPTRRF
jgi:hypothetical protein